VLEFYHVKTAHYPIECQAGPPYGVFLCGFILAFHCGSTPGTVSDVFAGNMGET
jgi:hypothetical protein